MPKLLEIVVPCYNEEESLPRTIFELEKVIASMVEKGLISSDSYVTYVDDGSRDKTWQLIEAAAADSKRVHGIKFAGNRGHQNAIMAGMMEAKGDMVVTIDADLQDDSGVIETMVSQHLQGSEIVYGVRSSRNTDTGFKRGTAELYYKLLKMMGVKIVFNHADYRLLGRSALNALKEYHEVNLFVRGMIPKLGFATSTVEYARKAREAGESKYPLKKMLALAWDGITSFSTVPLRFITTLGMLITVASILLGVGAPFLEMPLLMQVAIPVFFIGGVQLVSVGILGEYIGKIYMETKSRPRYHIEKKV